MYHWREDRRIFSLRHGLEPPAGCTRHCATQCCAVGSAMPVTTDAEASSYPVEKFDFPRRPAVSCAFWFFSDGQQESAACLRHTFSVCARASVVTSMSRFVVVKLRIAEHSSLIIVETGWRARLRRQFLHRIGVSCRLPWRLRLAFTGCRRHASPLLSGYRAFSGCTLYFTSSSTGPTSSPSYCFSDTFHNRNRPSSLPSCVALLSLCSCMHGRRAR